MSKVVHIRPSAHQALLDHCKKHGLVAKDWVGSLIRDALELGPQRFYGDWRSFDDLRGDPCYLQFVEAIGTELRDGEIVAALSYQRSVYSIVYRMGDRLFAWGGVHGDGANRRDPEPLDYAQAIGDADLWIDALGGNAPISGFWARVKAVCLERVCPTCGHPPRRYASHVSNGEMAHDIYCCGVLLRRTLPYPAKDAELDRLLPAWRRSATRFRDAGQKAQGRQSQNRRNHDCEE